MGSIWAVTTSPVKPISVMIRYRSQNDGFETMPPSAPRPPMRMGGRSYLLWRTGLGVQRGGSQFRGGAEMIRAQLTVISPWTTPQNTKVLCMPDEWIMLAMGTMVRATPAPYEPATRPAASPRRSGNHFIATPMQPP